MMGRMPLPRSIATMMLSALLFVQPAMAQVDVGGGSRLRNLVPAAQLETAANQQYTSLLAQAREKNALAGPDHPQLKRLREISTRLVAQSGRFNDRAPKWNWEVNLIGSKLVNAFCMPGGKIAVFTGLLDQLKLTDDEAAMVLGHEIAHALREHARARIAKTQGTGMALSIGAQLLGLGHLGDVAANAGTQLLALRFSRGDEVDADLVGLEIAARAGFDPEASITLWQKMAAVQKKKDGPPAWLSTHPSGTDRIERLRKNLPKVRGLYQQAVARR
jgi:predicted Zn-dependent protease